VAFFSKDLAIDLGTANTVVYVKNKGVVIREPTIVATDIKNGTVLAVGNDAKKMAGRTPQSITVTRPLRDGVIADFTVTENFWNTSFARHRAVDSLPGRACLSAFLQASLRSR